MQTYAVVGYSKYGNGMLVKVKCKIQHHEMFAHCVCVVNIIRISLLRALVYICMYVYAYKLLYCLSTTDDICYHIDTYTRTAFCF